MLLLADLVVIGFIASMLSIAIWRGQRRRARARATRGGPGGVDLIPGQPLPAGPVDRPALERSQPRTARVGPRTWVASRERGEVAPPRFPAPAPAPVPSGAAAAAIVAAPTPTLAVPDANGHDSPNGNGTRRSDGSDEWTGRVIETARVRQSVIVAPRGRSWIVRRDGAGRASSVHSSRAAAEVRARKTARRERVVLEIRDADGHVVDRVDFRASSRVVVS